MLRKIIDSKGEDDNAETELWAARQTHLEARLRPDPANRRPNTKPGERWDELVRLADALRQGYDVHLGCVCRPNRCHAESIVREVTALAQQRSAEAARGAGPSTEGASAEGKSDGAATRGAIDDPPNEQLEGDEDDSAACECEGEEDAFQDTVGDETETSGDPTENEGDPKPHHGLRGRRPY